MLNMKATGKPIPYPLFQKLHHSCFRNNINSSYKELPTQCLAQSLSKSSSTDLPGNNFPLRLLPVSTNRSELVCLSQQSDEFNPPKLLVQLLAAQTPSAWPWLPPSLVPPPLAWPVLQLSPFPALPFGLQQR